MSDRDVEDFWFAFSGDVDFVDCGYCQTEYEYVPWDRCQLPLKMKNIDLGKMGANFAIDLSNFKNLEHFTLRNDDVGFNHDRWPTQWDRIWFPESLEILEIYNDSFNQDLSYLPNLTDIKICGQTLDDWSTVWFPESVEVIFLTRSI